ncbi:MAG TPA: glycosyl hydrolase family 28 protein [Bryobacteraceae bacterium]|nr:glycosyl hydrolase family 28 protein [Bryobacteraceae bacterium]
MKAVLLIFAISIAHAQDTRTVTEPHFPPACATLDAHLAAKGATLPDADERKLDTQRIQEALDHCTSGKAVVLKAEGSHNAFLSGPLDLRRGVTLLIDKGAILLGSRDPKEYERRPGSCGVVDQNGRGCRALINGDGVPDAAVMGEGTIDGRGGAKLLGQDVTWWDLAEKARAGGAQNCPRILVLSHCDNFTLYKIHLRNSPNFHVSYRDGNGFTAWGVVLFSPQRGARNTDGIDPSNSTNVTITHCYIHAGDDNVAIKAGHGNPTTHMTIAHNHFYAGHGMSIGSETDGGASAIRVSDLSIDGADNGIRIKSNSSRGGLVHDVVYEDVCIRDTRNPIYMDSNYSYFGQDRDKLPTFEDITLRNVHIFGGGKITLDGYDESHRLAIRFDNVTLENPDEIKMTAVHARITLGPGAANLHPTGEDVEVTGSPGKPTPNSCAAKFVPFPDTP